MKKILKNKKISFLIFAFFLFFLFIFLFFYSTGTTSFKTESFKISDFKNIYHQKEEDSSLSYSFMFDEMSYETNDTIKIKAVVTNSSDSDFSYHTTAVCENEISVHFSEDILKHFEVFRFGNGDIGTYSKTAIQNICGAMSWEHTMKPNDSFDMNFVLKPKTIFSKFGFDVNKDYHAILHFHNSEENFKVQIPVK